MVGRKPIPTSLKILTGEKRKCRLNRESPQPEIYVPNPPSYLSAAAKEEWYRITPELEKLGIISELDRAALANYCQIIARLEEAEEQLEEQGLILKTKQGKYYHNPLIGIVNKLYEESRKYAVEFGMTPSSRARVKVEKKEPKKTPWSNIG